MSCSPPRDGEECAHPRSSLDLDPSAYASTLSDGSEAAVVEESSSEASIADGVADGAVHTESADVPVAAAVARPSFPRGHSGLPWRKDVKAGSVSQGALISKSHNMSPWTAAASR